MIPPKTVADVYVTLSGKIVAVHAERIWSTAQVEKRQEARNAKRKGWKALVEAGSQGQITHGKGW